jgi:hypothetical protein
MLLGQTRFDGLGIGVEGSDGGSGRLSAQGCCDQAQQQDQQAQERGKLSTVGDTM